MSVGNVTKIDRAKDVSGLQLESREPQRLRRELFRGDDVDNKSSDFSGYRSTLDPDTQAGIQNLLDNYKGDRPALDAACEKLGGAILDAQKTGGVTASRSAQSAASEVLALYLNGKGADAFADANATFTYLSVHSMEEKVGDLGMRLHEQLELQKHFRTQVTELQDMLTDWDPPDSKQHFAWDEMGADGKLVHKEGDLTKEEAQTLRDKLESQLQTVGDDAEMMKFDFQSRNQDMQQAVQTIAETIKMLHDEAMKILNNLK